MDDRNKSRAITFYARRNQRVEVYAKLIPRFSAPGSERQVVVTVDGNFVTPEPGSQFYGGFQDVTSLLRWDVDFTKAANVHSLGFQLADTQDADPESELAIVCIILIYGRSI